GTLRPAVRSQGDPQSRRQSRACRRRQATQIAAEGEASGPCRRRKSRAGHAAEIFKLKPSATRDKPPGDAYRFASSGLLIVTATNAADLKSRETPKSISMSRNIIGERPRDMYWTSSLCDAVPSKRPFASKIAAYM